MLRIHFTTEDLIRTTVSGTWGPFAESVLALVALRGGGHPRLHPWQSSVTADLTRPLDDLGRLLRPGLAAPPVDVFTLCWQADAFEAGRDAFLRAHPSMVAREFAFHLQQRKKPEPDWLRGLGKGDLEPRKRVAEALSRWHQVAVAPHWPNIRHHLTAEKTRLSHLLTDRGVEGLLSRLTPRAHWHPPVLEIPGAGNWHPHPPLDIHLRGRGFVLVPTLFVRNAPVPYFPQDQSRPAILMWPSSVSAEAAAQLWRPPGEGHALSDLLGRTRARALHVIATHGGANTSELARHLGTSVPTASQHATVLRTAGLVVSTRHRNMVTHHATALGRALIGRVGDLV